MMRARANLRKAERVTLLGVKHAMATGERMARKSSSSALNCST